MYTIESLLHAGNTLTEEQQDILNYMINKGYKTCKLLPNGARRYSSKQFNGQKRAVPTIADINSLSRHCFLLNYSHNSLIWQQAA